MSDSWWKFVFGVAPDPEGHSIIHKCTIDLRNDGRGLYSQGPPDGAEDRDPGPARFESRRGKGSHGRLYYGSRFTTVKDRRKEIGPGLLRKMLRDLGLEDID